MNNYFIHDGQNQTGPFSLAELKAKGIRKETSVWREGLPEWMKAGDIKELKSILTDSTSEPQSYRNHPPPFPVVKPKSTKPQIKLLFLAFCIIGISVFGYLFIRHNYLSGNPSYSDSINEISGDSKTELPLLENENPAKFAEIEEANMHNNLIGQKIIKGTFHNKSSNVTLKDLKVEVIFTSKTDTELERQSFVVYEYLEPGAEKKFRKVLNAPDGTEGFRIKVVEAFVK